MAEKKQFKAESKRLLDLMINSIYTHKEIFLRELISNASDATDKLYYKALTENISDINKSDLTIDLAFDKEGRTLTVTDHGIGMNKEELEEHLGTIANSGSFKFKNENESDDIDIIGQFGVGFYSAFMVAKKVEVSSRAYGSDQGYTWVSEASDGYEIFETDNLPTGTTIKLYLKDNTEEENYDENESFEVLPKNKTFRFYGATFKVKNEEIFIKKFNPHAKVFISATNKITEVTEINTKKIVKISEFDNIVVLARRQKNRDIKGTKIVIVDGEIQCEEEIYTFLNEIYLSKMLPEELQNEAKKLMIN